MTSWAITGKLGSGKSLVTVGRVFDYLAQGRKVATNLDIFLDKYLSPESKKTLVRLPDKPTAFDFQALGSGNESYDEEKKNGLLVLDELGSWFNSRNWQDKGRAALIDWFLHARKHGWDVMLIVQNIDMIDGQLRGALAEHLVVCRRLDRISIPFVGGVLRTIGFKGVMPKGHFARVHYGDNETGLVVDRWIYRGKHLYSAYDTKQIFSPFYEHGAYSLLSPWHTVGRFLPPKKSFAEKLLDLLAPPAVRPVVSLKPKNPLVEKIMKIPDAKKREEFLRRFQQCGAL